MTTLGESPDRPALTVCWNCQGTDELREHQNRGLLCRACRAALESRTLAPADARSCYCTTRAPSDPEVCSEGAALYGVLQETQATFWAYTPRPDYEAIEWPDPEIDPRYALAVAICDLRRALAQHCNARDAQPIPFVRRAS